MASVKATELTASLEDYLEAIFQIVEDKQAVRAKDIGERLEVGRSSVTGALHALADRELINYAPYDVITLTDSGRAMAEEIVRRHEVLRDFFVKVLSVAPGEAEEAACKMEHAISEAVLERFVEFVEFVDRCPEGGAQWREGIGYTCEHGRQADTCRKCEELAGGKSRSKTMTTSADAEATTLDVIKRGGKASIIKITGGGNIRRRLLDMGATAGTVVEVERVAPLGDPIEIKIKGYHLTLRKEEARRISVTPI